MAPTADTSTGRLLALDSATAQCSVALWLDGEVRQLIAAPASRNSEVLLPLVTRLLGEAGVSLGSLDAIAFGAGPGAFTGLRVACGVAQGLAFGADLPVVAVGTLEALAETHFAPGANGPDRVVAALDARMHECYWAELQRHGADWRLLRGPVLCAPAAVPLPAGAGWTGIGDAFAVFAEALATRLGDRVVLAAEVARYPEAAGVARLGALRWRAGAALPPEHAHPLYVRDKVALTAAERAAR